MLVARHDDDIYVCIYVFKEKVCKYFKFWCDFCLFCICIYFQFATHVLGIARPFSGNNMREFYMEELYPYIFASQ